MRKAFIVAGLAFGDEGKGATVDFLTRKFEASLVVRYNGGPQAGHNVIAPDGRWHTFSQFGSGTFVPGVDTYLSRFMLINPLNMMREEANLQKLGIRNAFERLTVDENCLVITPFHKVINQLLERARGADRHGTCGQGVGQCRSFHIDYGEKVLFAGDLLNREITIEKLRFLQRVSRDLAVSIGKAIEGFTMPPEFTDGDEVIEALWEDYSEWPADGVISSGNSFIKHALGMHRCVVFEGAQGVLLDEKHGTAPHNTWTNTTFENALAILGENHYTGEMKKIGVVRTYYTRHGAGPFPTECDHVGQFLNEPHNDNNGHQGKFRIGYFDRNRFLYALKVCQGVSCVAVNHLDVNTRPYQKHILNIIYELANAPICIEGHGPTANDRIYKL